MTRAKRRRTNDPREPKDFSAMFREGSILALAFEKDFSAMFREESILALAFEEVRGVGD
jgi:hypothetical protein